MQLAKKLVFFLLLNAFSVQAQTNVDSGAFYSADDSTLADGSSLPESSYMQSEQNSSFNVYTYQTKKLLKKVSADTGYRIISKEGYWSVVTFNEAVMTGWVSRDYVFEASGVVTINANRLNVRSRPSLSADVVTQLKRGYETSVISKKNGFIEIWLPTITPFAIKSSRDSEKGNSKLKRTPKSSWLHNESNKAEPVFKEKNINTEQKEPTLTPIQQLKNKHNDLPDARAERKHRISPGDTISLIVFGESDVSLAAARVPESGNLSFPLIGAVSVSGKTTDEIERDVSILLSQGYIKSPRISIIIDAYRPIFIKGAVSDTGSFPYSARLTVAKALALAGGIAESGNENGVTISRDGKKVASDLSIDSEYLVESGDIISVKENVFASGQAGQYVYLHGEVKAPGAYEFRKGLTIEKAIVLAGGFSLRASRKKVSVSRIVEGEEAPTKMKRVKLYMPIEPGDIVDVGASWF